MILKGRTFRISIHNCTPDFHDVLIHKYLQEPGSSARITSSKKREHHGAGPERLEIFSDHQTTRQQLGGREGRVVVARAARLGRDLGRALDLLERDAGVVGALEPVEAELAARHQARRHRVAVGPRADASVLRAGEGAAELGRAPVEDAAVLFEYH